MWILHFASLMIEKTNFFPVDSIDLHYSITNQHEQTLENFSIGKANQLRSGIIIDSSPKVSFRLKKPETLPTK
jgi:hypothetical protein